MGRYTLRVLLLVEYLWAKGKCVYIESGLFFLAMLRAGNDFYPAAKIKFTLAEYLGMLIVRSVANGD